MSRRAAPALAAALLVAIVPTPAAAKFGISKTRLTLARFRPPEIALVGQSVAVEVTSQGRGLTRSHEQQIRSRLVEALEAWGVFQVVDAAGEADSRVHVVLDDLAARVRESVTYEDKYVKTGEREEWNEKKKRYETKDVYGYRKEPVEVTEVSGRLSAVVEVETGGRRRSSDAAASYEQEFKGSSPPTEVRSEDNLERYLVEQTAARALGSVCFAPDPVEALLAVDGELKPGNQLAQQGRYEEALSAWSALRFEKGKEAARLHNLGVAREALAYTMRVEDPRHRQQLEQAADLYAQARRLDPEEKYFNPPLERIDQSLRYAALAADQAAERARYRAERGEAEAPREAEDGVRPANPAAARVGLPLRDGRLEAGSWTLTGRIAIVREAGSSVLEVTPEAAGASMRQSVDVELDDSGQAPLDLAYKVVSGDARIRFELGYADSGGRDRIALLQVTAGEGPGGWSAWSSDIAGVRPRPSRLRELRLIVEGGTVRLRDLALRPR